MSNITTLQFQSRILKPIQYNNQLWLTSADLALALDYKSTKSITNLYNQNSDEFTDCMAQVIDSVTVSHVEVINSVTSKNLKTKTRIFSLRGAHLIAMFSRTAISKEFRKWVLDILDQQTAKPIKPTNSLIHPANIKFINPLDEITMTFNRQEITQLHALFSSFEYMDSKFWPHIKALFPNLNNEYSSVFDTARLVMKMMRHRRQECKDLADLIMGKV